MDRALGLGSSQGEDSPNLQGVAPVVENWGLLSNRVWRFCKGVFFQFGNSASRIDVKDIISLSFETRDGRRYFVVKARDKKGLPRERLALMAKKDVTEEDVRRFLYDVNLAHLYVASKDDTRESAEGFGQDLQDLQD